VGGWAFTPPPHQSIKVTTQPTLPQVAFVGLGIRAFARSERFARYYRLNLREGE